MPDPLISRMDRNILGVKRNVFRGGRKRSRVDRNVFAMV